jgi:hypothetical protein
MLDKAETDEVEVGRSHDDEAIYDKQDTLGQGVDDALKFVMGGEEGSWTDEEERRVLRKIDLILVPLVWPVIVDVFYERGAFIANRCGSNISFSLPTSSAMLMFKLLGSRLCLVWSRI